jgi:hypothetical protein
VERLVRRPAWTASARAGVGNLAVGAEESLRRGRTKERAQARKQVSKKESACVRGGD